jgi:hypothetical protein
MAANRTRFRGRRERDPARAANAKRPGDIGTCLGSAGAAVYKQIINITFRKVVGGVAQTLIHGAIHMRSMTLSDIDTMHNAGSHHT